MEDGAFLGVLLGAAHRGRIALADVAPLYQSGRKPFVRMKQQMSFLNSAILMLPDGPLAAARDAAMAPELRGEWTPRSPNIYSGPVAVRKVWAYNAEAHAREVVDEFRATGVVRPDQGVMGKVDRVT